MNAKALSAPARKMVVTASVTDLRRRPQARAPNRDQDFNQESQLIFGEKVLAYEKRGVWTRVEALEQEKYVNNRWVAYPGWVQTKSLTAVKEFSQEGAVVKIGYAAVHAEASDQSPILMKLSLGTRLVLAGSQGTAEWVAVDLFDGRFGWVMESATLRSGEGAVSPQVLPQAIIETARSFIGSPYFWGGRSFCDLERRNVMTSVDCSGLVSLAFRANGLDVPRDSHDQFLKSRKTEPAKLQVAGLVFLASPKKPDQVTHVLLYAGEGRLVEAAGREDGVREVAVRERLGKDLQELEWGKEAAGRIVYFGSLLP